MRQKPRAVASVVAFAAISLVPQLLLGQSKPASSSPGSVISKFAGTWKEDVSKQKIGSMRSLVFRSHANGGLEELRGSELRPLLQPVNFTGKPYAIDGSKNTIAWKRIDSNTFERAIFNDGQLVNTRRIRLSAGGKSLTEETEFVRPGGRKGLNTIVFHRVSGDQGLAGRWKPDSFKTDTPQQLTYEPAGVNGLKVSTIDSETTYTVMLDGKPVPVIGRTVISNTMAAAKQIDGSTIEITQSREGVATGKSTTTISADGKILTLTTTSFDPSAGKEPSVSVYIKQ